MGWLVKSGQLENTSLIISKQSCSSGPELTKGPKLVRSQFAPVVSIKSPLKVLEECSYSDLLPFLPFSRHLDRDKNGRDEVCREEVRSSPLWHTRENK
jgi:hypothetical protein